MKIFILHGWTYSLEKWRKLLDLLKKKGIESVMLNVPGLTSKDNNIWSIEDYVKWLKEVVYKENGKVILIGHSNGGRILLNFTIKYPEKVSKLILIDSAGIYHNELPLALKRVIFKTLAKTGKAFKKISFLRNILYKIIGESDYNNATENMKQTMINLLNSDKFLKPEKIKIPTLIIWGEKDKITPPSDGKTFHRLIKNSKLEIIENARHSPMFTHPKEVAGTILNNLTMQ